MDRPFYDSQYNNSESSRRLFDDTTISGANREPCIVCGHPTGDCHGESAPLKGIAGFGVTESLKKVQTFYVEQDIYEERQITPFTKIKVLVHRAGKHIPYLEAEKLGLIVDKNGQ
jgi:hypothetical protein